MNNTNYNYRKARENELQYLIDTTEKIIKYNYGMFLENDIIILNFSEKEKSEKYIFKNLNECLIMELNNKKIGFSITSENKIHLLIIDKKYQNKNYGKYFLKYLEDKLFEKYNTIELQSFPANIAANTFYENNGWKCNEKVIIGNIEMYKYKKDK